MEAEAAQRLLMAAVLAFTEARAANTTQRYAKRWLAKYRMARALQRAREPVDVRAVLLALELRLRDDARVVGSEREREREPKTGVRGGERARVRDARERRSARARMAREPRENASGERAREAPRESAESPPVATPGSR